MRLNSQHASAMLRVMDGQECIVITTSSRRTIVSTQAMTTNSKRSQTSNNGKSPFSQQQANASLQMQTDAQESPMATPSQVVCSRRSFVSLLLLLLLLFAGALLQVSLASGQTLNDEDNIPPLDPSLAPPNSNENDNDNNSPLHAQQQQQQQLKLKPINFTLVEEIFQSTLSNDEVATRWKRMDSQLQDGMKAILKMIFPQIVAISQDAKVSGDCSGGILKWILSLRNLRSWAIKMLDATGKPTAGVFEGSLSMLGNYRQCLSIRAPDEDEIEITDQFEEYFRGQYCVLHLKPWMPVKRPFYHLNESFEFLLRKNYKYYEKTLYDELAEIAIAFQFVDIRMDLCVPSTCTVADIQRVADLLSKTLEMRAKVMRCDTAPRDTSLFQKLDQTTYLWLSVPLALITLSTISTILVALGFKSRSSRGLRQSHFCLEQQRTTTTTTTTTSETTSTSTSTTRGGKLSALFQSLSIGGGASGQSESVDSTTSKQVPKILHGLRNIFVVWFIIVQLTVELKYQYLRESLNLRNMILTYWPFQIIINSTLLFEALIVISAFIYGYTCIESSVKSLMGYLANKYIGLLLAIVTIIALTIVTPLLAIESPIWRNLVEDQAEVCQSTGYVDLFFLQNFINYDKMCLPHTWLVCVELQLIILMIPLMLDLRRNFCSLEESINSECAMLDSGSKSGRSLIRTIIGNLVRSNAGLLSMLLILIGYCVNFVIVYANELPPSWFYSFPDPEQKVAYFAKYLTKTWTHLSSFLIGLLAGHITRSHLQLRSSRLNREPTTQQHQHVSDQSPQLSHGSTSTIMAMEMSQANLQNSGKSKSRSQASCLDQNRLPITTLLVLVMLLTIMLTFTWSTQAVPSPFVAAIYDATSRLVWSLALALILYRLCHLSTSCERSTGAGFVERALCHPISTTLGKVSPFAYLVAPYVNTFVLAVEEQSLFPSMFIMFHVIFGNIVIIYALALLLATVIERPLRRLVNQV